MPPSRSLPTRRRVWLACTTCRTRKTRCNAEKPKCSLCAALDVECVYQDSQQLRIDPTAKLLLDRIQALEDRIFASPALAQPQQRDAETPPALPTGGHCQTASSGVASPAGQDRDPGPGNDGDIPFPYHHTAGANHLLNWPVIQDLFSHSPLPIRTHAATDVFFGASTDTSEATYPPTSWRLFDSTTLPNATGEDYGALIHTYFDEVNLFYPLLSRNELHVLENVLAVEEQPHGSGFRTEGVPAANYCLLLLVLCVGAFVRRRGNQIRLTEGQTVDNRGERVQSIETLDGSLWNKARLLLGYISSTLSLEAAQCSMIARYMTINVSNESNG
jgi:hypothetical protein